MLKGAQYPKNLEQEDMGRCVFHASNFSVETAESKKATFLHMLRPFDFTFHKSMGCPVALELFTRPLSSLRKLGQSAHCLDLIPARARSFNYMESCGLRQITRFENIFRALKSCKLGCS